MINTLNESSLHKALKTFYAVQFSAQEEVKVGRWICDLETSDGGIVEIQNKNVGALKEKIQGLLELKRRVTIVHPIITQKTIETRRQDGSLVSKRKSPKKENLYPELKEFTSIAELLPNKNLTLLLPEITIVEKRVQCAEPVQAKNGRRRFKKAWQKTGKALLTIGGSYKLSGKKDWLALLPSKALAGQKNRIQALKRARPQARSKSHFARRRLETPLSPNKKKRPRPTRTSFYGFCARPA